MADTARTANRDALLYLGTAKGVHILRGDKNTNTWESAGWTLTGHDISALASDSRSPDLVLAGTASGSLFRSLDGGFTWESAGVEFPGQKIWSITPNLHVPAGHFFIGIDGGHLFYSPDNGATSREMLGLRELPTAKDWFGPFGPAIFHSILPVPEQTGKLYLGLSVVGVLVSSDGGLTWEDTTANIPRVGNGEEGSPELADVHKLGLHPRHPARMYATTHYGTFRSDDGSQSWQEITAGLPFAMTRPLALHPTDPDTVFVIAHEDGSDGELPIIRGALRVYRSRNAGQTWQAVGTGLPDQVECAVLREALVTDEAEPCGVYLGNNRGQVFASNDEGDNWKLVAEIGAPVRVVRPRLDSAISD